MAEINPPSWLQDGCHTAQGDRQTMSALICGEGVQDAGVTSTRLLVSPSETEGLVITVNDGRAFVGGDDVVYQGYYQVTNDAPRDIVLGAADPTDPRIDLIVARVYDSSVAGGTLDEWRLEAIQGDPSPSPVAPELPETALPLAQVRVPADSLGPIEASQITDLRYPYQLCPGNIPQPEQPSAMPLATRTFNNAGSFTLDLRDYPENAAMHVQVQGGGGGGGNATVSSVSVPVPGATVAAGGGGGGGAYCDGWIPLTAVGSQLTVTVGAGGSPGGNGGISRFANLLTAAGGAGGDSSADVVGPNIIAGGGGGIETTGPYRDIRFIGGDGGNGVCTPNSQAPGMGLGGVGGAAGLGGKITRNSAALNGNGLNGQPPGGGGSGAQGYSNTTGTYQGGDGADGFVRVVIYGEFA